jgi:hypothetical protein
MAFHGKVGMSDYQITCVTKAIDKSGEHGHIVVVGTAEAKYFAVSEVERKMRQGDTFRTRNVSAGTSAEVEPYTCSGCGTRTLRSVADGIRSDNLDKLNPCMVMGT